ncbi:MAG: amino acid adenylation domain-containing protein, partial [bacterium]|nr:amino acid adenylation domain-containing protein [bacterium]
MRVKLQLSRKRTSLRLSRPEERCGLGFWATARSQPGRGRHAIRDPARGLSGAPGPSRGLRRPQRGDTGSRPQPLGDGRADRFLRQHPGAELAIGGGGPARGYLRRPAPTAENFVPDPFCGEAGARLYKSGDLARFLPDGRLEFLGRIDHQVKLRGLRLELGEIESVLAKRPSVAEAVVVVSDERLVAYVVGSEGELFGAAELWEALREELPAHMVHSAFVVLDALPRNPGGKVDRRALPAPSKQRSEAELRGVPQAPRDRLELALVRIWEDVLG